MNITKPQWEKILSIILSAALAVFAVTGWVINPLVPTAPADAPVVEQRSVERIGILCAGESGNCVEGWNGSGIAIYSDAGSTSKFSVTGSSGATTIAGNTSVGGLLRIAAGTSITVTDAAVFTPTASYQPITAAGTVTPTLSTATTLYTAGQTLVLVNTSAQNVVLVDTGTAKLGGNRTLGQYDVLELFFDGTNWLELSFNDN